MPFVNRRRELDRLRQFARAVEAGRPERHLAFIGPRRIGKSRLIERYLEDERPFVAIVLQVDEASTTMQAFLLSMVRATISGLAHHRARPPLPKMATPVEIAVAAGALGPEVAAVAERALTLVNARRPDGQQVFSLAVSLPEEIARAAQSPVIVFADEFQHVTDLAVYPPFAGGRRKRQEDAQRELLQVFRAQVERRPQVGWVVTGSGVRLLRHLLGAGPLMGRFDEIALEPFDVDDCEALAEAVWREMGVDWTDSALARVFRLTRGHPFYADVTCREAAVAALQLEQPVSASMVDGAFVDAVQRPSGQIGLACREMYESLTSRAPALRGFLQALAQHEPAGLSEIADRMQLPHLSLAYRYAQDLSRLGLVEEAESRTYAFSDPVFRYWVACTSDPLAARPLLLDPDAARRAARTYEEAFLRERELHGPLREGYVRETCRAFDGQPVDGRRFGAPGRHVTLPRVSDVDRIVAHDASGTVLGRPSEVELDLCFGDNLVWLAEVRDRARRAKAAEIILVARKAAFLRAAHGLPPGPTWFVSTRGFEEDARRVAAEHGVYVSSIRDIEAIRNLIATRRA